MNEKSQEISMHKARRMIVESALRWTNNIVVEVLNTHGSVLSNEERIGLRNVSKILTTLNIR